MAYEEGVPRDSLPWRLVRLVVPWLVLFVVVAAVWSLLSDYRGAVAESEETSSTVEATSTSVVPPGEPYVKVLSDGLNLRAEPSTSSAIVVVLAAEQQLILLEEGTGWYHVRTADGAEGWVAAGGRYTELVEP